jgi:type I restriction enzyme R subunit
MGTPSPNFAFLAYHDARLVALATQAEEHFADDPAVSLYKLRLFGEVLAKRAAARVALLPNPQETQQTLVERLFDRNVIGATQRSLFHDLRRAGNAAVHEGRGDAREALHQLRMCRELAVWFQRTFGNNKKFDPGPFVPPSARSAPAAPTAPSRAPAPAPAKPDDALQAELTASRQKKTTRAPDGWFSPPLPCERGPSLGTTRAANGPSRRAANLSRGCVMLARLRADAAASDERAASSIARSSRPRTRAASAARARFV